MAKLDQFLGFMLENKGSDLHISVNLSPKIRIHGNLEPIDAPPMTSKQVDNILEEICPPVRWEHFLKNKDLDFAYEIPGLARFRANYLNNHHGKAAVFRQIPTKILTMTDLNLPPVLKKVCELKTG